MYVYQNPPVINESIIDDLPHKDIIHEMMDHSIVVAV